MCKAPEGLTHVSASVFAALTRSSMLLNRLQNSQEISIVRRALNALCACMDVADLANLVHQSSSVEVEANVAHQTFNPSWIRSNGWPHLHLVDAA